MLILVIIFLYNKSDIDSTNQHDTIANLYKIKDYNEKLYLNILLTKNRQIKHYDLIRLNIDNMTKTTKHIILSMQDIDNKRISKKGRAYLTYLRKTQSKVNNFVTADATLNSLLSYYPVLSNNLYEKYKQINILLASDIIKLQNEILYKDRKNILRSVTNIKDDITKISKSFLIKKLGKEEIFEFITHSNKILLFSEITENFLNDFVISDPNKEIDELINIYNKYFNKIERDSKKYYLAIMFLFFILIGWVVVFIFHLNKINEKVRNIVRRLDYHKAALDCHAIVSITDIEGNMTYVNDKFCEISQYTKAELIGKNHRMLKSDEHDHAFFKELWETISAGDIWNGEIKNKKKNGDFYWVLTTILPILDDSDKDFQYISIRTDMTAIKKFEEELEDSKIDAVNSSKIKSQFLANMSHEIRTPLNAILGFSDILYNIELDKKNKEYAQIINSSANSLLNITNDILDISKIESGNLEIINEPLLLHGFIDEIIELFSIKAKEKNLRFIYYMYPQVPLSVLCDPTRLRQVISNLLSNAIKFTPQNGRIDFYIKLLEIENNIAKINFTIKDSGIGIDDIHKEFIFKPFQQADETINRRFGGTGLGLAISSDILRLFGSKIYINSNIGKGSEFIFTLDLEIKKPKNMNKKRNYNLSFILCNVQNGEYLDVSINHYLKDFGKVYNINDNNYKYADMLFCFKTEDFKNIDILKVMNSDLKVTYTGDENKLDFEDILKVDYFIDLPLYESKISYLIHEAFKLKNEKALY